MSACDHFTQNAWRPDLCTTCQRVKSEHEGGGSGPGSKWRRKSEPNPNNAITGVRISALASKFQAASNHDTDFDRARTLDRKTTRNKEKTINTSRSTELLDSSSISSSSLSTSTSSSTSAIPNSNRLTELSTYTLRADGSKLKSPIVVCGTLTSAASTLTTSSNAHVSVISEVLSDKSTQPHAAATLKPKLTSSVTNNSHGTARTAVALSSVSYRDSSKSATSGPSPTATHKSNSSSKSSNHLYKKQSVTQSSTSPSKNQQSDTQKETQLAKEKKVPKNKEKRRVSIPDLEPQVIGNDGGLDNLYPDDESLTEDDNDHIYFSLTDEEKQFALLALGNTVWNSDTSNLQVESEVAKRTCREFEDVSVDQLWSKERFASLVDCEPLRKLPEPGTFPQISHSKQSRVAIKNLSFSPEGRKRGNKKYVPVAGDVSDRISISEVRVQAGDCVRSASVRTTSVNSDSDGSKADGSACSTADSGVEMVGTGVGDPEIGATTNSLCKSTSNCNPTSVVDDTTQSLSEKHHKEDIQDPVKVRPGLENPEKKDDSNTDSGLHFSLTDGNDQEGFQAVAVLNDVLKDYGDINESSTDDLEAKNARTEAQKGKKSSDFEARMATVAARLDLTKQQQRGKRQAPRPPVSPPPEPEFAEAVSPKKVVNQPDPVFKMVTIGKSIVTLPPQQDMPQKNSKPTIISYGFEDFGSLSEACDIIKTNGDGKSKKGITSFFRNILRRGKDSSESFESTNPDVQLQVRIEKDSPSVACGGVSVTAEDTISSIDEKTELTCSSVAKVLLIPPTSPPQSCGSSNSMAGSTAGGSGGDCAFVTDFDTAANSAASVVAACESPVSASPPNKRKISKDLTSPQMMLRKATAKGSPPSTHHTIKSLTHHTTENEQDVSSLAAKPYPAPKPAVPPPGKPDLPSTEVAAVKEGASSTRTKESTSVPQVIHRRPKSPKRIAPPVPPTRTSAGTAKSVSSETRTVDLTKELETRLRKSSTEQPGTGTLTRSEFRESTRRSLPVPPSPPADRKEKTSTQTGVSESPPVSPIREVPNSLPSSPSSTTGISFDLPTTEWSGGSTSTIDDDLPKFSEKIELPTVANQGRKGFLGKLAGNRKTKAPQPPSVKRAKSITQSATLPRGDKKSKKINVADISGPVLVTDITNGRVTENRRNTISLGDEPTFVAMSASCIHLGGTSSSTSVEKSGFDEFDFPVLSPLGSLENLYESILPKPEGILFHYYDPPTSPKVMCPNIPSDGYLEPVPPLSSTAAVSATSGLSATLSAALSSSINVSSSSSSDSSSTTNVSVVKSPLKSKTSASRLEHAPNICTANLKDSGSSLGSQTTSASSSGTNSSENSGSSLPDPSQISSRRTSDSFLTAKTGSSSNTSSLPASSGIVPSFVEPEMTEQRRNLLASQPIYEEIPNGGNDELDDYEDEHINTRRESNKIMLNSRMDAPSKSSVNGPGGSSVQRVVLPPTGTPEVTKTQTGHTWLQLQQSHFLGTSAPLPSTTLPSSSSAAPGGAVLSSPSHGMSKQNLQSSSALFMSSSQIMSSSQMSTSLTSSMLPPPPPPPDQLAPQSLSVSCSASRETVSSESDTQSICSNDGHSNCSTLSRPRPAPRRQPKRLDAGGSDQYVSMNRPNAQVSLSEDKLRDVFTKLTSITFHALQDIYAQCEKILATDRLDIPQSKMLKWADFDIYGQPLHASGRCVVYNAKLRANNCPCQIMILHSRPATEMCTTTHPSLLRPSAVFADTIPFSYLTPDFIKTSQLLQNSVYDSSQARCFVAVGGFDIVESLSTHLALLRETLSQDLNSYLSIILTAALQLLSAMSHCLDQGFSVTETDYSDVFLITRSDLRGKVVAFLPRQRSLDVPQGEAMCNFLDRLLTDNMPDDEDDNNTDSSDDDEEEEERISSSPNKVVSKLRSLLELRKVECLGQVRTAVEYLLWGPGQSELSPTEARPRLTGKARSGTAGRSSREQELYVWLEQERLATVGRLARNVPGLMAGLSLEDFYTLKFLLKTSAGSLAESFRQLSR